MKANLMNGTALESPIRVGGTALELPFRIDGPLHYVVKQLLEVPDLYYRMKSLPGAKAALFRLVEHTIASYQTGSEEATYSLHRTLGWVYETQLCSPATKPVDNQFDPVLMEVQRELERVWGRREQERIPALEMPVGGEAFARWYKSQVLEHEAANHALFGYLENHASRQDMAYLFAQEVTVDGRFDDLVALAQLGQNNRIKMELAENHWDELGNGNYDLIHTVMFDNLLHELGVTAACSTADLFETARWESLACGNALLFCTLHRKNAFKALGAMGAVELLAPLRFHKLVRGFERLGLSERACQYHTLHIQIDARHGNGWLYNAIAPAVDADPAVREEIIAGTYYRLNTSLDYLRRVYDHIRGI
jgi:hypothetical protein